MIPIDVGSRFGRWVVLSRAENKWEQKAWLCRCDCKTEKVVSAGALRNGTSQSCGCLARELTAARKGLVTMHGHSYSNNRKPTPEYISWKSMLRRCNNPKNRWYHRYGGRGIKAEYQNFEHFLSDLGLRPGPGYSLDRIDNDGNYAPGNCRWATLVEQSSNTSRNRYIEFNGERRTITEWEKSLGGCGVTIHYRLKRGWSIEKALTTPIMNSHQAPNPNC